MRRGIVCMYQPCRNNSCENHVTELARADRRAASARQAVIRNRIEAFSLTGNFSGDGMFCHRRLGRGETSKFNSLHVLSGLVSIEYASLNSLQTRTPGENAPAYVSRPITVGAVGIL
jgi:hypothetical protein